MDIDWIRSQLQHGGYLWSLHADEERRNDGLEIEEVETAMQVGVILEDYPNDPRGPSCLVFCESKSGPMHVVCGANRAGNLVIITVYRPSSPKWKTPRERGTT